MTTYDELKRLQDGADQGVAALAAARRAVDDAAARGDRAGVVLAQRRIVRAEAAERMTAAALEEALESTVSALDPAVPVLLLPVRLETRYDLSGFQAGTGTVRLRVRVYPDDIHLDGHEGGLAPAELEAGRAYWSTCWSAHLPADLEIRRRAWTDLAARFGAERAAWIAERLTPTNLATALPGSAIPADDGPTFPDPDERAGRWTRATVARLLPDFWRVQAWRGDICVAQARSRVIRDPLPAGPDPAATGSDDAGLAWMTDFSRALDVGMAAVLDLPGPDPLTPLDLLTVIGVRGTQTPDGGAADIAELLSAHRFSDGLDLLAPGVATNNSDLGRSAHGAADPGGTSRFVDPFGVPGSGATATTLTPAAIPRSVVGDGGDSDRLTAALAVPLATAGELPSGTQAGVALERDLATALWPGTWGYYLTQLLRLDEWDTHAATYRRWVLDTVRGGGPLPALRVGRQPYGVLPVLSVDRWRPAGPGAAGLVAVELVVPRKRAPVRGVAAEPVTQVRVLGGLDDATWTFAVPTRFTLPTPAGATRVAATTADLDGDGLPELVVAHAATVPMEPPRVSLTVAGMASDGPHIVRQVALGQLADGSVTPLKLPSLPVRGLAVALGRLDPTTAGHDLAVVLQTEPTAPGGPPPTLLLAATGFDGQGPIWWDPIDVTDQLAQTEQVTSAALVEDVRGGSRLVLVTEDSAAVPGTPTARWRVSDRLRQGAAPGWGTPEPVGPLGGPDATPITAALTLTSPGQATGGGPGIGQRALLASYHALSDGTTAAGYVVGQNLADGRFDWPQGWYANLGEALPRSSRLLAAALVWVPWTPFGDPGVGLRTEGTRVGMLRELRRRWRTATPGAARVRAGDPDVDRTLLDLLSADAVSQTFEARPFIGSAVLANTWHVLGHGPAGGSPPSPTAATPTAAAAVVAILDALGVRPSRAARLGSGGYTRQGTPVTDDLTGSAPDDSPSWLSELVEARPQKLHDGWTGPDVPLLARLLRHSLLQAYADAAMELVPPGGDPPPLPEPELVDLADLTSKDPVTPRTLTSWRHLASASYNGRPVADVLYRLTRSSGTGSGGTGPLSEGAAADLVESVQAARRLIGKPARVLEWALGNVLDLGSHRLDAWITALATNRLGELRSRTPRGLHTGGFGLVTDLAPRSLQTESSGYVHAPSMTHAVTAAVLRSGHLTHVGAGSTNPFAVDLSSARVRTALAVLDSVGKGQPLGAVLGYRFERELYGRGLAGYLDAVRQLVPLEVGLLTPVPAGVDVRLVAPMTTTDGLALLRLAETGLPWGTTPTGGSVALPPSGSLDQVALGAAIEAIRDTADAIADLGLAESVHQLVLRNPVRAAATVDALTRGEVPVNADPDVLRTPRLGNGVTHRLLLIAPDPAEPAAAEALTRWTATDEQRQLHARATAEPRLDAWAATILPDPATVRYRIAVDPPVQAASGVPVPPATTLTLDLTLDEVGLSPYDVLAASPPTVSDLEQTNLGRRLLRHAARELERGPGRPAGTRLSLMSGRAAKWTAAQVGLEELLTHADRARTLVRAARPLDVADLSPAAEAAPGSTEAADELAERARAAAEGLQGAVDRLRPWFELSAQQQGDLAKVHPGPDGAVTNLLDLPLHLDVGRAAVAVQRPDPSAASTSGELGDVLDLLAGHGLPGAAAGVLTGDDDTDRARLAVQARAVSDVAKRRLTESAAVAAAGDQLAALEAVFGEGFRALPVVHHQLGAAARPTGAQTPAVEEWLDDVADVRDGAARLRDVLLAAELLGGAPTTWDVVQTPGAPGDPWVALPTAQAAPIPAGRTSIVAAVASSTWRDERRAAGLLVDGWVEVVPVQAENTALAFHLDSPDACAPQALMLAVAADPAVRWTWDSLADTVRDALDLVRLRAVDPDLVPDVGHLLPTALLAHNVGGDPAGDTISTVTGG